ncbi:hypothetical protein D3C76_1110840 [compost metagenome]
MAINAKEATSKLAAGFDTAARVSNGGGGGDTGGAVFVLAAIGTQTANQAGGFGTAGTSKGMRLIEDHELQKGVVKQLQILLASQ